MADDKIFNEGRLKLLLKKAKAEPLNFALALGSSPEEHVIVLHLKKAPKMLFQMIKKQKGLKKGTWGTAEVDGKTLILNIEKKLAGVKKKTKQMLKAKELLQKKVIVKLDGEEVADDDDEEEETPGEAEVMEKTSDGQPLSKEAYEKASEVWTKTRTKVQSDLQKLQSVIRKTYAKEPFAKDIDKAVKKLDGILDKLDASLADKLKEAASATVKEAMLERQQEARGIVKDYLNFVNTDRVMGALDDNPFQNVQVKKTLINSLDMLQNKLN